MSPLNCVVPGEAIRASIISLYIHSYICFIFESFIQSAWFRANFSPFFETTRLACHFLKPCHQFTPTLQYHFEFEVWILWNSVNLSLSLISISLISYCFIMSKRLSNLSHPNTDFDQGQFCIKQLWWTTSVSRSQTTSIHARPYRWCWNLVPYTKLLSLLRNELLQIAFHEPLILFFIVSEFIAVCLNNCTDTFSVTANVLSLLLYRDTHRASCFGWRDCGI